MIPGGRRYILYGSRSAEISMATLADIHYGNRGVAIDHLKSDIARIADDPYAFWLGGGDYADLVGTKDKRFDPEGITEELTVRDLGQLGHVQMKKVRDLFSPIADKCVGVMKGNHEDTYEIANEQQQLVHWLATELNTRYLGYCCFLDLHFVRVPRWRKPPMLLPLGQLAPPGGPHWSVRIFAHHGSGFAQTPGGKLNKLIQFMDYFQADLTIIAHIHDQNAKRLVRLRANEDCEELVEIPQVGMVTGTYLRTYATGEASYGEKRGFRPVPLGAVSAKFRPDKKELRVEI